MKAITFKIGDKVHLTNDTSRDGVIVWIQATNSECKYDVHFTSGTVLKRTDRGRFMASELTKIASVSAKPVIEEENVPTIN